MARTCSRFAVQGLTVLSLACLTSMFSGCGSGYSEEFREEVTPGDFASVAEKTGLVFPPDIVGDGIWITHRPTHTMSLKASLTDKQVDEMLRSGPIKESDLLSPDDFDPNESEQSSFPPNRLWWNPGTQEDLKVATAKAAGGGVVNLGVLRSKRGNVTIYITWDEKTIAE